jgi:protein-S-isoprenylcysteine O-methyltransferase Ste14
VIRHPIYTGILLAITGTALTESLLWFLPLVVAIPYFILAARREERLMLEQFPDQYPGYRRRTKMLIPWLV